MAKPAPDDHDSATGRRLFAPNDRSTGKQAEHHSAPSQRRFPYVSRAREGEIEVLRVK
jgi:hypothetical protein